MSKILLVHNGRRMGGAPRALGYIIRALVNSGWDTYVACVPCPETRKHFVSAGAQVILLDTLPRFTNTTSNKYTVQSNEYASERKIAEQYTEKWRSLLQEHGPFTHVVINSVVLCDLIQPSLEEGCKVIQFVRETSEEGPELDVMCEKLEKANAVVFISEYDRDMYSLNNCCTYVVPDFADPKMYYITYQKRETLRKQNKIEDSQYVVLYTGGDNKIKGPHIVLDSMARIKKPKDIVLIYAGYTHKTEENRYKKLIKYLIALISSGKYYAERLEIFKCLLGRKMEVIYTGYSMNIEQYFKIADLCLVPYSVPHQAMPIFEAGMAGIPCIASKFRCFEKEIENGKNGLLVSIDKPKQWARAIEKLADNRALSRSMGDENKRKAYERHDMQSNIYKIIKILEK